MKNPFWKIKSILIFLLIPFSLFLILISILVILSNEKDRYLISLFLISSGAILSIYSFRYAIKTNKSFKRDLITHLNDNSRLITLFHYEKAEWSNFAEKHYHQKIKNYKITLYVLIPVITSFLIIIYIEDYRLFIMLSFLLLSFITFISLLLRKYLIEFKSKLLGTESPNARITTSGILINDSYIVSYNNQDGSLTKCNAIMFLGTNCLEFKIRRFGGRGHNYQYFNLLIPQKNEQDIENIESRINECAGQK